VEREISSGERFSFGVAVSAGQFASVSVEHQGFISTKVLGPDGRSLALDGGDWLGRHRFYLLAESTAEYHVELSLTGRSSRTGRFSITLTALEPATEQDKERVVASRLFQEAEQLSEQATTESRRQATRKYQEALSYWKELGELGEQAHTLLRMCTVFDSLPQESRSLDCYQPGLALARASGDRREEARLLLRIAGVARELGDNRNVLEYHLRALELARAAGDREEEGVALNGIGEFYFYTSDQQKALKYFEESLQVRRAIGDSNGEYETLGNLGSSSRALGEPQKALGYYSQALAVRSANGYLLHNIGNIYYDLNEPEKALEYLNQALSIRHAAGDLAEAFTLAAIGHVYRSLGQPGRAVEYYQKSLPIMRLMGDRQGEAMDLNNMGKAYALQGDQEKAIESYNQALPIMRAVGDRRGEAAALSNFGEALRALDQPSKALEYFSQALAIQRALSDPIGAIATLYGVARTERDLGHLAEARSRIESALEAVESLRASVSSEGLRTSYLASKEDYYGFYVDLLMRMDARDRSGGYAALALQASERARARSLLEVLNEARADIREGVDRSLLDREKDLRRRLNARTERLTRLLSNQHNDDEAEAAKREVASLLNEYEEVQLQIRVQSPRYAALAQPVPLSLGEIQEKVLDRDTVLLEYSLGEEKSYLWAVTPDSVKAYELPKRAEVEGAARRVYELLTVRSRAVLNETPEQEQARFSKADADYAPAASGLSQMILRPAAAELGTKRLVIVTQGALQYVPFAALPEPQAGEIEARAPHGSPPDRVRVPRLRPPLAVDHEIVSLPSASVLAILRRETAGRQAASKAVAVLADPVFRPDDPRLGLLAKGQTEKLQAGNADALRSAEESGLQGLFRLRFSRIEADAVAMLASDDARLEAVDFEANRATATSAGLRDYRIVHFATHGLINSQHPELSGIVLSLVDKQGRDQDGFLRLYEIYNLKLNADLVVLSACQTALGKEIKGEGLIGLTRGFMYAGAARVVASLWRIDDRATAELMKRFYTAMLQEKMRPAAALRAAQVSMWKDPRWAKPHYWAAFTIQGEFQ
jgi:CHAT domain-containing protein/tetratricopeptide (TPR) repeat protein